MIETSQILLELLCHISYEYPISFQMKNILDSIRRIRPDAPCLRYFGTFQSRVDCHSSQSTSESTELYFSYYDWKAPPNIFSFQQIVGMKRQDYLIFQEKGHQIKDTYQLEIGLPGQPFCFCLENYTSNQELSYQSLAKSNCRDRNCCGLRWIIILLQYWRKHYNLEWNLIKQPGRYLAHLFIITFKQTQCSTYSSNSLWRWLYRYYLPFETNLHKKYTSSQKIPGLNTYSILDYLTNLNCRPHLGYEDLSHLNYLRHNQSLHIDDFRQWQRNHLWCRRRPYFFLANHLRHKVDNGELELQELYEEWEILLRLGDDLFRCVMEFI